MGHAPLSILVAHRRGHATVPTASRPAMVVFRHGRATTVGGGGTPWGTLPLPSPVRRRGGTAQGLHRAFPSRMGGVSMHGGGRADEDGAHLPDGRKAVGTTRDHRAAYPSTTDHDHPGAILSAFLVCHGCHHDAVYSDVYYPFGFHRPPFFSDTTASDHSPGGEGSRRRKGGRSELSEAVVSRNPRRVGPSPGRDIPLDRLSDQRRGRRARRTPIHPHACDPFPTNPHLHRRRRHRLFRAAARTAAHAFGRVPSRASTRDAPLCWRAPTASHGCPS